MALSKDFISFFKELEQNNYREWFHANKKRFEKDVKKPFEELTQQVIDRMRKIDPEIHITPKDSVFRIHRDVRFSKDKSPYKTHMAAVVSRGGRKDMSYPGIYFQVTAHAVMIAGGIWQPDKDRLYRIREKIADDPKAFRKIVDAKKYKETFGELNGEKNKRIPKEFVEAGETVPEIYNKSFHYWRELRGQKYITAKDLDKILVDHYKIASKFNDWLVDTA
jgi:uncharacterized protein (TIGR02453 family)